MGAFPGTIGHIDGIADLHLLGGQIQPLRVRQGGYPWVTPIGERTVGPVQFHEIGKVFEQEGPGGPGTVPEGHKVLEAFQVQAVPLYKKDVGGTPVAFQFFDP